MLHHELPRWYRVYLSALGILAALIIAAAGFLLAAGTQRAVPAAQYLLKDNGGRLALYTADGAGPLAQYDVYTRLLPEEDLLALQQGVAVCSDAELQQKLEDYGM